MWRPIFKEWFLKESHECLEGLEGDDKDEFEDDEDDFEEEGFEAIVSKVSSTSSTETRIVQTTKKDQVGKWAFLFLSFDLFIPFNLSSV